MNVSQAVARRRSCRKFSDRSIDRAQIVEILDKARRAPSGGNLQPWHAVVLAGEPLQRLIADIQARLPEGKAGQSPEYDIYPPDLAEPYRARRFGVGEALYDSIGIGREDKTGRMMQMAQNFNAFGAPVVLFVHTPRFMGPPQWSDIGMWLQTIMLLVVEAGLQCCPQEAWSIYGREVRKACNIADDHIFFTGLAIGHGDEQAAINRFEVPRAPLEEMIRVEGL